MTQKIFEIEKDIPMPDLKTKGSGGKYWRHYMVMEKMEIGDSFLIDNRDEIKHSLWNKLKDRVWSSPARLPFLATANKKTGKKFIARWVEVGKTIRVWRAE
tara:strand:- start:736 stop:1038 length:303 start_codon:yes stop_codon:yes gene_type:complete